MNPRTARRNQLFGLGIVPALVVLLLALDVGLQIRTNLDGRAEYDDKDYANAEQTFLDATGLDLPESWVRSFNAGAAAYQDARYDDAAAHFESALGDAPDDRECTVRVNLALTHEAVGDQHRRRGNRKQSLAQFGAARRALEAGGCADGEGESVDRRLAAKILAADRAPADPNAELSPEEKLAKLEELNARAGEQKRRDPEDLDPTEEPDTPIEW